LSFIGLAVGFNYLIINYLAFNNWLFGFGLATILTVLAAFGTKLVDLKAFLGILKSRE
jgi:hypothetical protein